MTVFVAVPKETPTNKATDADGELAHAILLSAVEVMTLAEAEEEEEADDSFNTQLQAALQESAFEVNHSTRV